MVIKGPPERKRTRSPTCNPATAFVSLAGFDEADCANAGIPEYKPITPANAVANAIDLNVIIVSHLQLLAAVDACGSSVRARKSGSAFCDAQQASRDLKHVATNDVVVAALVVDCRATEASRPAVHTAARPVVPPI
jgi:hypothetical protein